MASRIEIRDRGDCFVYEVIWGGMLLGVYDTQIEAEEHVDLCKQQDELGDDPLGDWHGRNE